MPCNRVFTRLCSCNGVFTRYFLVKNLYCQVLFYFHAIVFSRDYFHTILISWVISYFFRYKSPSPGVGNAPPLPPHQPRSAVHHPFLQAANFPGNQHRESGPNFQGVRHSESGPNFHGNRHSENGQGAILETIKVQILCFIFSLNSLRISLTSTSRRNPLYLFQTVVLNHCGCTPRSARGVKRSEIYWEIQKYSLPGLPSSQNWVKSKTIKKFIKIP